MLIEDFALIKKMAGWAKFVFMVVVSRSIVTGFNKRVCMAFQMSRVSASQGMVV